MLKITGVLSIISLLISIFYYFKIDYYARISKRAFLYIKILTLILLFIIIWITSLDCLDTLDKIALFSIIPPLSLIFYTRGFNIKGVVSYDGVNSIFKPWKDIQIEEVTYISENEANVKLYDKKNKKYFNHIYKRKHVDVLVTYIKDNNK